MPSPLAFKNFLFFSCFGSQFRLSKEYPIVQIKTRYQQSHDLFYDFGHHSFDSFVLLRLELFDLTPFLLKDVLNIIVQKICVEDFECGSARHTPFHQVADVFLPDIDIFNWRIFSIGILMATRRIFGPHFF